MLNIKIIMENGCLAAVLKDSDEPVNVEVISIDTDYKDCRQLKKYRDSLYRDPKYKDCDYKSTNFDDDI